MGIKETRGSFTEIVEALRSLGNPNIDTIIQVREEDFSNPLKVIKVCQKNINNIVSEMFKKEIVMIRGRKYRKPARINGGALYSMVCNLSEMQSAIMRIVPYMLYIYSIYTDVGKPKKE